MYRTRGFDKSGIYPFTVIVASPLISAVPRSLVPPLTPSGCQRDARGCFRETVREPAREAVIEVTVELAREVFREGARESGIEGGKERDYFFWPIEFDFGFWIFLDFGTIGTN